MTSKAMHTAATMFTRSGHPWMNSQEPEGTLLGGSHNLGQTRKLSPRKRGRSIDGNQSHSRRLHVARASWVGPLDGL